MWPLGLEKMSCFSNTVMPLQRHEPVMPLLEVASAVVSLEGIFLGSRLLGYAYRWTSVLSNRKCARLKVRKSAARKMPDASFFDRLSVLIDFDCTLVISKILNVSRNIRYKNNVTTCEEKYAYNVPLD